MLSSLCFNGVSADAPGNGNIDNKTIGNTSDTDKEDRKQPPPLRVWRELSLTD